MDIRTQPNGRISSKIMPLCDRNPWIYCSPPPLPLPLIGRSPPPPPRKTIRKYIFILKGEKIVCIQRHLRNKQKKIQKTLIVIAMGLLLLLLLLYCRQICCRSAFIQPQVASEKRQRRAETFQTFLLRVLAANEQIRKKE